MNRAKFIVYLICCFTVVVTIAGCRQSRMADDPSTLVVAISTFSEATFLPWNGSTGRKVYMDTIYDYLIYIDPESGELQPGLAERWEVSSDGKIHTFWLRKGVYFQKGWGELTARDIKFSVDNMTSPKSIAGPASPLRSLIESVDVKDRYQVEIRLAKPDIEFARAYLSNGLIVPIVCKEYIESVGEEAANEQPVGTGAYVLEEFKKDVSMKLRVRADSEHLWRVNPAFQQLLFLSVPEEFTRVAMLKTGEADLAPINYDSIRALDSSGLQVLYINKNWAPVIRLGGMVPKFADAEVPWKDKRVRQALNYAIDKNSIVETIFHGQAQPVGVDFPSRDFDAIPPYPYDPEKARELLREAGYPNGFDIKISTYTTNPGAELPFIAQIVALYWNVIGVRTKIEPTNWVALRSAWSTGKARDIGWTHRGMSFPSSLAGLQTTVMSSSVFASYANATTDHYLDRIGASLDPGERKRLVVELANYLRDEAALIYIAHVDEPYGASNKIGSWPALSEQTTNVDLITRADSMQ